MPKVEINIDTGKGSSVKIDGEEMSGLITEIHLDIKPRFTPVMTVKLISSELKFSGECSIIKSGR